MSKASLENELRTNVLAQISEHLDKVYNADVLSVSASELAIPMVDAEGNECYVLVKVSIPRGTRNGDGTYTPYDGYAAAEDWKLVLADRADKAKARQEKAERAEAARERKRAAKKVVKKLNEQGLDAMIHAEEES